MAGVTGTAGDVVAMCSEILTISSLAGWHHHRGSGAPRPNHGVRRRSGQTGCLRIAGRGGSPLGERGRP